MAYIFTTRRLGVRRFCGEDLATFRALMRDIDSRRFLSFGSLVTSKAAARQLLEETIAAYDSPKPRLAYAVELRMLSIFVGLAGISWRSTAEAEVMYAIAPQYRGQGLAKEPQVLSATPGTCWAFRCSSPSWCPRPKIQRYPARTGVSQRRPYRSSRLRRPGGEVRAGSEREQDELRDYLANTSPAISAVLLHRRDGMRVGAERGGKRDADMIKAGRSRRRGGGANRGVWRARGAEQSRSLGRPPSRRTVDPLRCYSPSRAHQLRPPIPTDQRALHEEWSKIDLGQGQRRLWLKLHGYSCRGSFLGVEEVDIETVLG